MDNHPIEIFITFPAQDARASYRVEWMGDSIFEILNGDPFLDGIHFGDQLVLKPLADGEYEFIRKHKESDFQTLEFTLTQSAAKSTELAQYLDTLSKAGCEWEMLFGGILLIHFPKSEQAEWANSIPAEIRKLA